MSYDDIKHKTLAELHNMPIEQLYEIFKQRYEEQLDEILMKQWSGKNG